MQYHEIAVINLFFSKEYFLRFEGLDMVCLRNSVNKTTRKDGTIWAPSNLSSLNETHDKGVKIKNNITLSC